MFHTVNSVRAQDDFILLVRFDCGEHKQYCVRPLIEKVDAFRNLATIPGLFNQVKVGTGGYGISWNDDIDLACDELYFNGVCCEQI